MRKTTIRILLLFTACFAAMHATARSDLPELNTNPGTLSLVNFSVCLKRQSVGVSLATNTNSAR